MRPIVLKLTGALALILSFVAAASLAQAQALEDTLVIVTSYPPDTTETASLPPIPKFHGHETKARADSAFPRRRAPLTRPTKRMGSGHIPCLVPRIACVAKTRSLILMASGLSPRVVSPPWLLYKRENRNVLKSLNSFRARHRHRHKRLSRATGHGGVGRYTKAFTK